MKWYNKDKTVFVDIKKVSFFSIVHEEESCKIDVVVDGVLVQVFGGDAMILHRDLMIEKQLLKD